MTVPAMVLAELNPEQTFDDVKQLERKWLRALIERDRGVLDEIWADDYWMTLPDGTRFTKADCLAGLSDWAISCDLLDPSGSNIRLYAADALVHGRTRVQGRLGSRDLDVVVRYIAMYSRRRNRWQQVATAFTRILVLSGPPVVCELDAGDPYRKTPPQEQTTRALLAR